MIRENTRSRFITSTPDHLIPMLRRERSDFATWPPMGGQNGGCMLRIGLVGLDMSHAVAFTEMLNSGQVPGARVTVAWAGGSPDFPLSWSRVEQYTRTVREQWQVRIVNRPAEVAEGGGPCADTATDGRVHRSLVEQLAPLRKPILRRQADCFESRRYASHL